MAPEGDTEDTLADDTIDREGKDVSVSGSSNDRDQPPALPPRPTALQSIVNPSSNTKRPPLQSKATTALSSIDIQTLSFPDGSRGTFPISSDQPNTTSGGVSSRVSRNGSEVDDNASLISDGLVSRTGDLESLLGNGSISHSPAWKLLSSQAELGDHLESIEFDDDDGLSTFDHEFDEVPEIDSKGGNEGWLRHLSDHVSKAYFLQSSASFSGSLS
jgi:vacuolar fusion protein MON1